MKSPAIRNYTENYAFEDEGGRPANDAHKGWVGPAFMGACVFSLISTAALWFLVLAPSTPPTSHLVTPQQP